MHETTTYDVYAKREYKRRGATGTRGLHDTRAKFGVRKNMTRPIGHHDVHRRHEITSGIRFIVFLVVLSLAMFLTGRFTLVKNSAASVTDPVEYVIEEIKPGDTLWGLAKKYKTDGDDMRKFIFEIKKLNGISDSNVYPGQLVKVPI
ncbi:MAG: LysM peptidoglycan-binding domain-containing protein [Clostridiales Family XIII bacterium]|jgi:hypothetical protein|nr:LysM peptidoglycan-binding domain-containing protein [Clostridiales Family XIII bacterium]